jgi:hypothetical protein
MKPSDVGLTVPKLAVPPGCKAVAIIVAQPIANPVFVEVTVTVLEVFGATPVTVTKPVLLIATEPPLVAVPAQMKLASTFEIMKLKPSGVGVASGLKVGVSTDLEAVAVIVAEPETYSGLEEITVIVLEVFGTTRVTVTKPVLLIATEPPLVADPAQLKLAS